jgi:hypothetical protein
VAETGRELLGETLAHRSQAAMARHSQAETMAVLQAAQQAVQAEGTESFFGPDNRLKVEAVQAVRERLGETARAFAGPQGSRDLAVLTAAGMQPRRQVEPAAFRQAAAEAQPGRGEQAPGRTVPRALGLDPVAAGAHFAALNQFARISEQAGLTPEQRQQLLQESQAGAVSPGLRQQIEGVLRQRQPAGQAVGLKVDDLIASAQAIPETLHGPVAVKLPASVTATPAAPAVAPIKTPLPVKESGVVTRPTPALATVPAGEAQPAVAAAVKAAKLPASPPEAVTSGPLKASSSAAGRGEAVLPSGRLATSPPVINGKGSQLATDQAIKGPPVRPEEQPS